MADAITEGTLGRLEDFIRSAQEGKDVTLEIALRKQIITQKIHPDETEEMKSEIDMYLLLGDYIFRAGERAQKVSKVYMLGSSEESQEHASVNKNIANERLKMDYKRLRDAGIIFEEKYY